MLTQELRPKKFSEMVGNDLNKSILKAIAHDPDNSPSTIIMEGSFGSGKCVAEGTRVLTNEGYVQIESLYPEGEIGQLPYEGNLKVQSLGGWVIPSDVYKEEKCLINNITMLSGHKIGITNDHKLISMDSKFNLGWVKGSDIKAGMVLCQFSPMKHYLTGLIIPADAQLVSLMPLNELLKQSFAHRLGSFVALYRALRQPTNCRVLEGPRELIEKAQVLADSVMMFSSIWRSVRGQWKLVLSDTAFISMVELFPKFYGISVYEGIQSPDKELVQRMTLTNAQFEELSKEMAKFGETVTNPVNVLSLRKWMDESELVRRVVEVSNWCIDVVESVSTTVGTVYDLSVPGSHSFVAEGFMNHNTTSARLLARALNCSNFKDDLCGHCEACTSDINGVPFYTEYDVTAMGNVEAIKNLRDTFYFTIPNGTRVITLDEVHTASRQAMSALLKVFEEAPKGVKFILATTDVDKLLPTIRSRSIELRYTIQSDDAIKKNILEVSDRMKVAISEEVAELIAVRSKGHMRNAHMLLDQYTLIGTDAFIQSVRSSTDDVLRLMVHLRTRKKDAYCSAVDSLLTYPLADLVDDFQKTLLDVLKVQMGILDPNKCPKMAKVGALYGKDLLKIIRVCTADWVLASFQNDITLQTALLALFQMFQPVEQSQVAVNRNQK